MQEEKINTEEDSKRRLKRIEKYLLEMRAKELGGLNSQESLEYLNVCLSDAGFRKAMDKFGVELFQTIEMYGLIALSELHDVIDTVPYI